MLDACHCLSLDSLGVLRARGADALSFLQGQLSNDMRQLAPDRALLAGYHNPQGRVIALLRVLQLAGDDVLALLPRELIAVAVQRLTRFILRSKVKVADDSPQWAITGLIESVPASEAGAAPSSPPAAAGRAGAGASLAALPATLNGVTRIEASLAVRVAEQPPRWLLVSPAAQPLQISGCRAAGAELWRQLAVAAGEPQVYAATSEEFVAQMLNLDVLGAIAFDKGCYTGQEIIARAHYRGRVKRRMQRFLAAAPAQLHPGEEGELQDGRPFKVVDAVQRADGRCEFLAVTTVGTASAESGAAAGPAGAIPSAAPAPRAPLAAQMLALPYTLPE